MAYQGGQISPVHSNVSRMRSPPGVLPPASPAGSAVTRGTEHASLQGTQISHNGIVTVNLVVDDLEIPFMAIRDSVRFLHSLFPSYSLPAFIGGVSLPNEIGATYELEKTEKKTAGEFDGADKTIQVRRKMRATIKDIVSEQRFKVVCYEIHSKLESDIFKDVFPAITYVVVEIKAFPYEQGKYHMTVTYDGGPHDVEAKYCCFCMSDPGSRHQQEEAQEMRPAIYVQAASVISYVRDFDPQEAFARQANGHGYRQSFGDDGSKVSNRSGSKVSKGHPNLAQMRADSSAMQQSAWSTGSPPTVSSADEIKKLYELLNMGAITKTEFESEKSKLLGTNEASFF